MTESKKVECAIRNVAARLRAQPWEVSIEAVLLMVADELAKESNERTDQ